MTDADSLGLGALHEALESSPALVALVRGPEQRLVFQNRASRELFGPFRLGVPMADAVPAAGRQDVFEDVMRTGRVVHVPGRTVGPRDLAGGELVLQYVLAPFGPGPPHDGVVITAIDVTHEARAEESLARAELLATLAGRMSMAPDPDHALQALTDCLVPAIADVAAVFVATVDQPANPSEPVALTVAAELLEALGPPPPPQGGSSDDEGPWDATIASGRSVIIDLGVAEVRAAINPQALAWLDAAKATTLVVLPLSVAGSLAGAVVLASAGERAPYAARDLPFLEDAAARAGVAVSALRSFRRQRQIAIDLQRALLPAMPPVLRGLQVAARYVAGAEDVDIGGDWWDVTNLGAGRVGVGVGDVSGRGVPAAVIMGQIRSAMRAAARAALPPADVLGLLDTHTVELLPDPGPSDVGTPPRFATAAYAVLEPFDEVARVASAGHPPMLVRGPDGKVEAVAPPPGPPLGLGLGPFEEIEVPFRAGSLLVAYTDGLVEARTHDLDAGLARVTALLEALDADADLDSVADLLLGEAAPSTGEDDIALVLVRLTPEGAPVARIQRMLHTAADVPLSRRAVAELAGAHLPDVAEHGAHVADELLTNSLEHAGAPASLRAFVTTDRLVIEVSDTSALVPRPTVAADDEDHGRGLALVGALADAWGVRLSRTGKTTWAELHSQR